MIYTLSEFYKDKKILLASFRIGNKIIKEKLLTTNYSELIGQTIGYDLISTDKSCSGFCNYNKKIIAYDHGGLDTIYHEMAHAIQAELEMFEKSKDLISEELIIERQAEYIAWYLYNFTYKPKSISYFDAYTKQEDVDFLVNWYDGYKENDLQ